MSVFLNAKADTSGVISSEIAARLPGGSHLEERTAVVEHYRAQEFARCIAIAGDLPPSEVVGVLEARSRGSKSEHLFSPDELTLRALLHLSRFEASAPSVASLEGYLSSLLRDCAAKCAEIVRNLSGEDPALALSDTLGAVVDARILSISSGPSKKWGEWTPDPLMDEKAVAVALKSLPGVNEAALPHLLVKYEDPQSPSALVGAVKLEHHDVIHLLLRRGLLDQDEAFVLGFTIGTATGVDIEGPAKRFKEILSKEYSEPYRIPGFKLRAFDLGVECALASKCRNIFEVSLAHPKYLNMKVAELRAEFGITDRLLQHFFAIERERIPHTLESVRLPFR